jgi:hypothetical protein
MLGILKIERIGSLKHLPFLKGIICSPFNEILILHPFYPNGLVFSAFLILSCLSSTFRT